MLAKGIGFFVNNSGYQHIINITTFTPGAVTWKTEDTTSHDSTEPVETFSPTIRNDGKISIVISPYLPDDLQHIYLRGLANTGASNNFRITYPNSSLGSFDVVASVQNWTFETPVNGLRKAKCDLLVNGPVVDDAAMLKTVTVADAHAGVYVTGDTAVLVATFDEIVKVTGTPRISITLGSGTVFANYASGTNTNVLTFSKTFGGGDTATATHFTVTSPIGLNSGTILDAFGQAATLTFTAPTTDAFTVN